MTNEAMMLGLLNIDATCIEYRNGGVYFGMLFMIRTFLSCLLYRTFETT